jgi:hypothetical protein
VTRCNGQSFGIFQRNLQLVLVHVVPRSNLVDSACHFDYYDRGEVRGSIIRDRRVAAGRTSFGPSNLPARNI